jgi:hypothetical protein
MNEGPSESTSPSNPFIGEVGGEVFIIFPSGVRFYKKPSYNWALNIVLQSPRLCNWAMKTTAGSPTYNTSHSYSVLIENTRPNS